MERGEGECAVQGGCENSGLFKEAPAIKGVQYPRLGHSSRDLSCKLYSALDWRHNVGLDNQFKLQVIMDLGQERKFQDLTCVACKLTSNTAGKCSVR